MAVLSAPIVAQPPQPLAPHDASWLNVLRDDLALIEGEIWDQERSDHPGAKHRLTDLRICADDRRRQIALLRIRAEAFS